MPLRPLLLFSICLLSPVISAEEPGWRPLFNGTDLSGWDVSIKGQPDKADPKGYFTFHDGMIHTYKDVPEDERVTYGVFQTQRSYSHYRLRFEYKWGAKKFAPRKTVNRDAGLLIHCFEPDRTKWTPGGFPLSVECQVQEHDSGDLWFVSTRGTVALQPGVAKETPIHLPEAKGGVLAPRTTKRVHRAEEADRLEGWNEMEVEVLGDRARYWVNGVQVMEASNFEKPAGTGQNRTWQPLTEGRISFQCEAAEVFYRNIEILELPRDAQPSAATANPQMTPHAFPALSAALDGKVHVNAKHHALAFWKGPQDRATWKTEPLTPGRYQVVLDYAVPEELAAQRIVLTAGAESLTMAMPSTQRWANWQRRSLGEITITRDVRELSLSPAEKVRGADLCDVRVLYLVPAGRTDIEAAIAETQSAAAAAKPRQPPVLKTAPGFEAASAITAGLVQHPMMACLNDEGALYVAESAGINAQIAELMEKRAHSILKLTDTDGDGVYDRRTVFADQMVLPNGACWHEGALYVASSPFIWRLADTDGDGVADVRERFTGKFGENGMACAFHGPFKGPEGRLYWTGGQHGWKLGDLTDTFPLPANEWTSRAPGAFCAWPDGSDAHNIGHGGLANPVEITFTEEGEPIGTVAVYDTSAGRKDAVLHWLEGGIFNLRNPQAAVHPRTSPEPLPPFAWLGWVAPSGLTRCRSGVTGLGFGKEDAESYFVAEFNTHRILRVRATRSGASFTTTQDTLLESDDTLLHFTDVLEDADGSLLVLDTGGWFLFGCPTSAIARPDVSGGIYRVRKTGAKNASDPRGLKLDWKNAPLAELITRLGDDRFVVRDRATDALGKQGVAAVDSLRAEIGKSSVLQQRHALWALTRIPGDEARRAVMTALRSPEATLRHTAAHSLSARPFAPAAEDLIKLLADPDAATRREAATALALMKNTAAVPALITALEQSGTDAHLQHALTHALTANGQSAALLPHLAHRSAVVRQRVLAALAGIEKSPLPAADVLTALRDADAGVRRQAADILQNRAEWAPQLRSTLEPLLTEKNLSQEQLALLGTLLQIARKDAALGDLVAPRLDSMPVLHWLAESGPGALPDSWRAALQNLLTPQTGPELRSAVLQAAQSVHLTLSQPQREIWLTAKNVPPEQRVLALLLGTAGKKTPALPAAALDLLIAESSPATATPRRVNAARAIAAHSLSTAQLTQIQPVFREASPMELSHHLATLARVPADDANAAPLLTALAASPARAGLTIEGLSPLLAHLGKPAQQAAAPLLQELKTALVQRDATIQALDARLQGKGDAAHGPAAFAKASCIACHRVKGQGGIIGPDLSTLGAVRSRRDLLEAILYPSATFAREYEPYILTLKDSTQALGRLEGDHRDHYTLIDAAGQSRVIPAAAVQSLSLAPVSLMPPGLEKLLTEAELADLVAYLLTLR